MNEGQKKRANQVRLKYSDEGEYFTNASRECSNEQLVQRVLRRFRE